MAVDYSHRLIVQGPHDVVRRFRRQMYREYPRTLAGRTWTEIVTFSFAALYEIAPAARRIEPEVPYDPYDLCDWPIRRVSVRQSEVRYRFHTRNLEMIGLIRALSRELPSLTFMLTTFCLDDNSIIAYRLRGGKLQQWTLPERQQQFHWERTLTRFRLEEGEVAYANEEARGWHEEQMLAEPLATGTAGGDDVINGGTGSRSETWTWSGNSRCMKWRKLLPVATHEAPRKAPAARARNGVVADDDVCTRDPGTCELPQANIGRMTGPVSLP